MSRKVRILVLYIGIAAAAVCVVAGPAGAKVLPVESLSVSTLGPSQVVRSPRDIPKQRGRPCDLLVT